MTARGLFMILEKKRPSLVLCAYCQADSIGVAGLRKLGGTPYQQILLPIAFYLKPCKISLSSWSKSP